MRYITLPNGRKCGLAKYIAAFRTLKQAKPESMWPGWDYFSTSASSILSAMHYGIHDRINRHIPAFGAGRKWSSDYDRAARNCARCVNTPRLVVREGMVPFEFRTRLAHRISHD